MTSRFIDHILKGTLAARPAASAVPAGTIYSSTTDNTVYQSDGSSWGTWLVAAAGGAATDAIYDAKGDLAAGTGADAASRLAVGADGSVLTADASQATGLKWAVPSASIALLSTTTLGADGIIDVSGISGAYNDLIGVVQARSANAGSSIEAMVMRFNNDSGSTYGSDYVRGNAGGASSTDFSGSSVMQIGRLPQVSATANWFGISEFTIVNYASTSKIKQVLTRAHGAPGVGSNVQEVISGGGWWNSTAAITRIQIGAVNYTNLVSGAVLRLYGRL